MIKKAAALLMGVMSCIPAATLIFGSLYFNLIAPEQPAFQAARETYSDVLFDVMLPASVVFALIDVGIVFFTDRVPKTKRILWVVVLLVTHMFALPFFWFHYIWKKQSNEHYSGNMEEKSD